MTARIIRFNGSTLEIQNHGTFGAIEKYRWLLERTSTIARFEKVKEHLTIDAV